MRPNVAAAIVFFAAAATALGCSNSGGDEPQPPRTDRVQSKIIGGEASTTADDFAVFVTRKRFVNSQGVTEPGLPCGGTLVAPNLVLTAKHCIYEYLQDKESICDASGEPLPAAPGGFVTGNIPASDLAIYAGVDGRGRYASDSKPESLLSASGKQIVDDEAPVLCSHDLSFLVLSTPIANNPIGKLRLGKRPEQGSKFSLAGWGRTLMTFGPANRARRNDITVLQVGAPFTTPDAFGNLGPRSFETSLGGCFGDSGSPGFDPTTGAVFGVLARALNLVGGVSNPCADSSVSNVYMTIADFPSVVRAAFKAAGAEPWLEGHATPGWVRWGEACASHLECEGAYCDGFKAATAEGAPAVAGTCNIACKKTENGTCPASLVCGATTGKCEPKPKPTAVTPTPTPEVTTPDPVPQEPEEQPRIISTSSGSCASTPARTTYGTNAWLAATAIICCGVIARRIGLGSRRRRSRK